MDDWLAGVVCSDASEQFSEIRIQRQSKNEQNMSNEGIHKVLDKSIGVADKAMDNLEDSGILFYRQVSITK